MQLTNTTDYAIRIVCYLAKQKNRVSSTELSKELDIPVNYIPKITKFLKNKGIVYTLEGMNGGYGLLKRADEISLFDVISSTESTMAISRCLKKDGFCSRNKDTTCKVHKILLGLQKIFNDRLQNVKISDIVGPGKDEYYGRYYLVLKVDLTNLHAECIYSHDASILERLKEETSYKNIIEGYIYKNVYKADQEKLRSFLSEDNLEKDIVNGGVEEDCGYRRLVDLNNYIWMEVKKYIDWENKTALLTFHNSKVIPNTMVRLEKELEIKEKNVTKQYWNMVSLLVAVLNHNNLVQDENQDNISFYTRKVYEQLQKYHPEYGISNEEIEDVSHLAPIHDIGKIRVPIEILNKNGKLTVDEMEVVKQHPLVGAVMTMRFPKDITTDKLNKYSYEICRYHHERYDGNGYPDGLVGEQIPLCAQVVGLVDAYDALVSERPYKKKLKHEEAVRMIVSGECGKFSDQLIQCFLVASMHKSWIEKSKK